MISVLRLPSNHAPMNTNPILRALFSLFLCLPALAGTPQALTTHNPVPEGLQGSDWQSIRAAHEAWKHEFRQVNHQWQAHNPGQRWTTTFDGRGFLASPKEASWTWGLRLENYGFGSNPRAITGTPEIKAAGQRLSYHWRGGLEEWFVNDGRGLEHGFIVAERPEGAREGEPLIFTLSTVGGLQPSVAPDAQTVHFRDSATAPVLNYSGLKVWDAQGTILKSWFEPGSDGHFRIAVEEANAKYPLTIDPIAQQAYLKAGNNGSASDDQFGTSVAVSGETVVVGASREDSGSTGVNGITDETGGNSGAVYVFIRSGSTWIQQAFLKPSNSGVADAFGISVAISGDTLVVGATGEDGSSSGIDGDQTSNLAANSGAAYVFHRTAGTWSQQAYLKASNTGIDDKFGYSVAVSGDTIVVGANEEDSGSTGVDSTPNDGAESSGAAYVFIRSGSTWSQQAYLKASNTEAFDLFGSSVSVSGETVVVGAYFEDSSTTGVNSTPDNISRNSGAAYVFFRNGTTWSQQAYLKAGNNGFDDLFGWSVAVSGDTIVVGARDEDSSTTGINSIPNESAPDAGAAYVFFRSGTTWSQQAYLKASNTGAYDEFGRSVSTSGDTVVVGATGEGSNATGVNGDGGSNSAGSSGAAYVFVRSGGTWSHQAYLKASNTGQSDRFGYSVSVSGDTVVAGAIWEDSNTIGVNSTPNNAALDSGAAYVFHRDVTAWNQQAYLKASNTGTGMLGAFDDFGWSVSVAGDTVVVGAPGEDSSTTGVNNISESGIFNEGASNSGAAYVFVRAEGAWSQQAYLKASNTGSNDKFGSTVSVSGDTVVVSAPQEDSGSIGVESVSNENAEDAGAAYIFVRVGDVWSQQAYLKASNTETFDFFGRSVAVSGNTVVVGANQEDSNTTGVNSTPNNSASSSGAAYVFVRDGTAWSQQAYLKASNTGASDLFGSSVAVSGNTAVVGAYGEDSSTTGVNSTPNNSASSSGAAYVFVRDGTAWSQQAFIKASNTGANDHFGISVAVSGDTLVVGSRYEDSGTTGVNTVPDESVLQSGAGYIFHRQSGIWSQQAYLKASHVGANDNFGESVAVAGDTVVIGAWKEDSASIGINSIPDDAATDSGAAYVFVRSGAAWTQQAYLKPFNTGQGDEFGYSVGVSGDTIVVGASKESSSTTGVNSNPDEIGGGGAAYIFTGLGPVVAPPEIVVAQAGVEIESGDTKAFGTVAIGNALDFVFTVSNLGEADLALSGSPNVATTGSSDLIVTSQPTSPITGPSGSSTFTVRFTPTGSGLKSATLTIPNNDSDENPFVINLTGTVTTASALFSNTITSGTGLTGNDALPTATPFKDGVENLLKYAFNMNLAGPDVSLLLPGTGTSGLPSITAPDDAPPGTLRFEFLRRKGSGLIYTPEKSTTLNDPSWSPLSAVPVITSINDQWERVVYTEPPAPVPAPACFGRVEVTLP